MSIRQQISDALKAAQKEQDRRTTSTLRLVCAALKDRDIAERANGRGQPVPEDQIIELLGRMVRQRREAAEQFRAGNRPELAEAEEAEIDVIHRFMPRPMTEAEMEGAVDRAIAEADARGLKDMGRVMARLKRSHPGQIDGAAASALVKRRLG